MCPNAPASFKHQQGFLIPLALFIIVGIGALAVSISRMGAGAHTASIRAAISVQSLFAAESGTQYALSRLLYDASSKADVDNRCLVIDPQSVVFTVAGLNNCVATLDCTLVSNAGGSAGVYQIQSSGVCGAGDLQSQRVISVKARYSE